MTAGTQLRWTAEAALPAPADLAAAIEECLLRASHLESQLDDGHLPADARLPEAIERYGAPSDAFQIWATWAALEQLRRTWAILSRQPVSVRATAAFASGTPSPGARPSQ